MNIREFLQELAFYFPVERNKEDTNKLLETYVDDLLFAINKDRWKGYKCNFDILLKVIRCKYQYKKFPSIAEIVNYIPEAMTYIPHTSSGNEGKIIKRFVHGREYEFTVVPADFNCKTISELDAEIRRINERG